MPAEFPRASSARAAWDAAIAAHRQAEKSAREEESRRISTEIAAQGQRALVLHGSYYTEASLVWVRPSTPEEESRFSADWRAVGLYEPLEWQAIDRQASAGFLEEVADRQRHLLARGMESSVILITEAEWASLVASSAAELQAMKEAKASAENAEAVRLAAAQAEASRTGSPVEIARELIETETEDGLVLIRYLIHGDGSRSTTRTICG